MKVSIINDTNGQNRIHAAGCADVAKDERKFKNDAWTIEVDSLDKLGLAIWSDIAGDHNEPGTPEHLAEVRELLDTDAFLPCVGELPRSSGEKKVVGVTRYSPNGHYLKAVGTSVKSGCGGSTAISVQREGEFTGPAICSRCEKWAEKGGVPLTAEQFNWSGETPRLIAAAVQDSVTELATVTARPEQEAPEVKPEPKKAARKSAPVKKTSAKPAPKATPKATGAPSATATELLEFVALGFERGVLTSSQKSSYKTVTRRLMEAQFGEKWEKADVFSVSLEALDANFRATVPGKSEITYKVYVGDFRKALEFFAARLTDEAAWEKAHPAKAAK